MMDKVLLDRDALEKAHRERRVSAGLTCGMCLECARFPAQAGIRVALQPEPRIGAIPSTPATTTTAIVPRPIRLQAE